MMPASARPGIAAAALLSGALLLAPGCGRRAEKGPSPAPAPSPLDLSALKPEIPFPGRIVFQSDADGRSQIYGLTRNGVRKLTDGAWSHEYPRWSPDGARIAFTANPHGNYDIFVMNADGSGVEPVVETPADETEPAWLPDGTALAFVRGDVLWTIDLATKAERRAVPGFDRGHGLADYAPAGGLIAFTAKRLIGWDVFILDPARGTPVALTDGGRSCRPRFSPDGKTIAYVSTIADGRGDIWLMAPDGSGRRRLTERSETVDYFPAWSPDGKEIVFCSSDQHSPRQGRWSLFLAKIATGRAYPLFAGFERALFPDWR